MCSKLLNEIRSSAESVLAQFRSQAPKNIEIALEFLVPTNCLVIRFIGWKKFVYGFPDMVNREIIENRWTPEELVDVSITAGSDALVLGRLLCIDELAKTDGIVL